jgi:hypothetical protein
MNWIEHLELLEEEAQFHPLTVFVNESMPDSLADAFCIVEQIIGQTWEETNEL